MFLVIFSILFAALILSDIENFFTILFMCGALYGFLSIPAYIILWTYKNYQEDNIIFTYKPIYKDIVDTNKTYVYDIRNETFVEGVYTDVVVNSNLKEDVVKVYEYKVGKILWFLYPIASYRYENDYVYVLEKSGTNEKVSNNRYFPKDSVEVKSTLILN